MKPTTHQPYIWADQRRPRLKQFASWLLDRPVLAVTLLLAATMVVGAATTQIDLTFQVKGVLPAANGGTASQFVAFTGPTAARTFTLPDSSQTIETQNNKNAANGYAGLDGSTKLLLAQGQEVWGIVDLTDVAAKTGSGTTVVFSTSPTITTPTISGALGADLNLGSFSAMIEVANEGTTGTTVDHLAKLTGAPSTAIISSAGDAGGTVGVVVAGAGITGNAQIAIAGRADCDFTNATTAGNYVKISATVAGECEDAGAAYPTSGQVIGRVLVTNGVAGVNAIHLFGPEIRSSALNFGDHETPAGTINGVNAIFTLANTPSPATSVELYLNGVLQEQGGTNDYTISAATITYNTAPASGSKHLAWYRY